tara:strand:- start:13 stop:522 length:510 start_codon:yes stop_codon:yes gene_type:complete
MKKFYIIGILFFVFFLHKHALSNEKIFFIDIDYIINNSEIGKSTLNKINEINKENILKLKKREQELKEKETEIKNKKNIISEKELAKEIDLFKNNASKYNDEKNLIIKEFNDFKKKELNKIFEQISPIVQSYMDENSIEILIDSKYVFMGKKSSDMTEKIIEKINANIK